MVDLIVQSMKYKNINKRDLVDLLCAHVLTHFAWFIWDTKRWKRTRQWVETYAHDKYISPN